MCLTVAAAQDGYGHQMKPNPYGSLSMGLLALTPFGAGLMSMGVDGNMHVVVPVKVTPVKKGLWSAVGEIIPTYPPMMQQPPLSMLPFQNMLIPGTTGMSGLGGMGGMSGLGGMSDMHMGRLGGMGGIVSMLNTNGKRPLEENPANNLQQRIHQHQAAFILAPELNPSPNPVLTMFSRRIIPYKCSASHLGCRPC